MKSPRNKTVKLSAEDRDKYGSRLIKVTESLAELKSCTIHQDFFECCDLLPLGSVDLIILDPPYNLSKNFHGVKFKRTSAQDYEVYLEGIVTKLCGLLKPTGTMYICSDWFSSPSVFRVVHPYLVVRNRITWEREKGRGSKTNWKNNLEDVWYCTASDDYTFNHDAVMIRKKVVAPYKLDGKPKGWKKEKEGNFRLTHHSNVWTDITVPFWSMKENTDHPAQKPEKLLAKLILASSSPGDIVLDPFVGSGSTSVVAKKLDRRYVGIEKNRDYCLLAEKRLEMADEDDSIQGYKNGVFLERNAR